MSAVPRPPSSKRKPTLPTGGRLILSGSRGRTLATKATKFGLDLEAVMDSIASSPSPASGTTGRRKLVPLSSSTAGTTAPKSARVPSPRAASAQRQPKPPETARALRPSVVLEKYGQFLSDEDKHFLINSMGHRQVYYVGVQSKPQGSEEPSPHRSSPESEQHHHRRTHQTQGKVTANKKAPDLRSHVGFRYELVGKMDIAVGWYGYLYLAYDYAKERQVGLALQPLKPHEVNPPGDHLVFSPLDRFEYNNYLVTVVEPKLPAIEILCARTEFEEGEEEIAHEAAAKKNVEEKEAKSSKSPTGSNKKGPGLDVKEIFEDESTALLLTDYERSEIRNYKGHIYFLGKSWDCKIKAPVSGASNFGYDDESSLYIANVGDHIAYRYEVGEELGSGSFGKVVRAKDHKTGQYVALKIIKNLEKFHTQAKVEIRLLDRIRSRGGIHSGCITMLHHFRFRSHVCITFEVCGMNLYELQRFNKYRGFSLDEMRVICKNVLTAMNLLWQEKLIHCDIKPENILVCDNENPIHGGLRLIDFGSGCREGEQMYTYIQSRFYRAPEIMLGMPYDRRIDMWSFGCCVCEMAIGYPLFPGESEPDQMSRILEVIPYDGQDFLRDAPRRSKFFHSSMKLRKFEGVPHRRNGGMSLKYVMKKYAKITDPDFIDFLYEFLQLDPVLRAPPEEALVHPFLTGGGGGDSSSVGSGSNHRQCREDGGNEYDDEFENEEDEY